jgi:hypothetical protein
MSAPPSPAFERCPKCGHAPLPIDQALPAACPACGLVLAKYGCAPVRAPADSGAGDGGTWSRGRQLIALANYVPERVDKTRFWIRVTLLLFFAVWGLRLIAMDYRAGEMGSSFLHGPLLVFHEAGHVVFSLFGHFMTIAGGTLGQLIMPAVLCGALLVTNRDPFGAAIGLWLIGVSLLDVSPYVYDALYPQLTLLGGGTGEQGGHDWIYLLGELHLLKRAHGLGWLIHKLGAVIVLLSIGWGSWLLWQQHTRLGFLLEEE